MSKHARAVAKQKRRQNKSQSRNAKRKQKYAALAGTQSVLDSVASSYSAGSDAIRKKGMTKVQKKRLAQGKDPKGFLKGGNSSPSPLGWWMGGWGE